MPIIMPIKDLRNTTEISNIAHKEQEPIFITKNGYSDLVVMAVNFMINLQAQIALTKQFLNLSRKLLTVQKQLMQK